MKLFKRRKKKVDLGTKEHVEIAKQKVNDAFIMFHQAQDAIDESNAKLYLASIKAENEIESLNAQKSNAEKVKQEALDTIEANKKLSEQLKPFLQ